MPVTYSLDSDGALQIATAINEQVSGETTQTEVAAAFSSLTLRQYQLLEILAAWVKTKN